MIVGDHQIIQYTLHTVLCIYRKFRPGGIIDILPLAPEDVLPVDLVLLPDGAVQRVPVLDVEPEVDVAVLVVVVVEDTVRLPGLPPECLQSAVTHRAGNEGPRSFHSAQRKTLLATCALSLLKTSLLRSDTNLEVDPRVVNDPVIVDVEQHEAVCC